MSENKAEIGSKEEKNLLDRRPDHHEIFSIKRTKMLLSDREKSPRELQEQIEEEMLDLANELGFCAKEIRTCLDRLYKEGQKTIEEKQFLWCHASIMLDQITEAQTKTMRACNYWHQEREKEVAADKSKSRERES